MSGKKAKKEAIRNLLDRPYSQKGWCHAYIDAIDSFQTTFRIRRSFEEILKLPIQSPNIDNDIKWLAL